MQPLVNPLKNLVKTLVIVRLRDFSEGPRLAREVAKGSVYNQVDHIAHALIACAGRIKDLIGGAVERNRHVVTAKGVEHASSWHAREVIA